MTHKLGLVTTMLVCINVILGAGIFINVFPLMDLCGGWAPLAYIMMGFLFLPLISVMSKLSKLYPSGGFYVFGSKELGDTVGFMATWSYFVGKLATGTLVIHTASSLIKEFFSPLQDMSVVTLDIYIIALFTGLNFFNMKIGGRIQIIFTILKIFPLIFIIGTGLSLFTGPTHFIQSLDPEGWKDIVYAVPSIIFVYVGFEVCCSLSLRIKNPEKNLPKAILMSFLCVILAICLYQLGAFLSIGDHYEQIGSSFGMFLDILHNRYQIPMPLAAHLNQFFIFCIIMSALGGGYGIIYSNTWNYYMLAKQGHTFFSKANTWMNNHQVPFICVLMEAGFCLFYIFLTKGSLFSLQSIGSFGIIVSYFLCCLAYTRHCFKAKCSKIMAFLSLAICLVFMAICLKGVNDKSDVSFLWPLILLLSGFIMFYIRRAENSKSMD